MWEGSFNNTHCAIDMIPKDVVICDWYYERPDPTAVYFAIKGFRVITCPWRKPQVAIYQLEYIFRLRQFSTNEMKRNFQGMMQTVWSGTDKFLDGFYGNKPDDEGGDSTPWNTFNRLYSKINDLENEQILKVR
jgi:hypothetical protein